MGKSSRQSALRALLSAVVVAASGAVILLFAHAATVPGNANSNGRADVFDLPSKWARTANPFLFPNATTLRRDPLQQPFSSSSIWNMPIGSGAKYVAAGLTAVPRNDEWAPMPQMDDEPIILTPTAPLTPLMYNGVGWDSGDRCVSQGDELAKVPIPPGYTLPSSRSNNSAAFLMPDGRTILQSQPLTRCTAGGIATSLLTFPPEDLYGLGITGSHGGSGLSAIGGSIRLGELRPGQRGPRHALKVSVDSQYELYKCTEETDCYRWPATRSDTNSVGDYGSLSDNHNTAMKMGALLALPTSVDINTIGLESEPGRELAWTLQNYGAYVVDSTDGAGFSIAAETGPSGSVRDQFLSDYGMDFDVRVNDNTPWSRDMQRLRLLLSVVDNNTPTTVGGGGTPLQPLAPDIAS